MLNKPKTKWSMICITKAHYNYKDNLKWYREGVQYYEICKLIYYFYWENPRKVSALPTSPQVWTKIKKKQLLGRAL